jgi:mono/diheme cytochrome c family protein
LHASGETRAVSPLFIWMLRNFLDLFPWATAVTLGLACACASAQAPPKPGPMQSGRHAEAAAKDAAAGAAQPTPANAAGFDGNQLFATSCGWCHFKGGRADGKGPKLMGTPLTDAEIVARIRNGKPGQMPAYGSSFSDDQLRAIVAYIRELKP